MITFRKISFRKISSHLGKDDHMQIGRDKGDPFEASPVCAPSRAIQLLIPTPFMYIGIPALHPPCFDNTPLIHK